MSLIVEDGTGANPLADSYVSIADCQTYATAHSLTFTDVPADQESKLRRATQYLNTEYTYRGEMVSYLQPLAWPRDIVAGVPREIVSACCELACKPGDLWADVDPAAIVEDTVGPLTTKYANPANGGQVRFAAVDALVRRWVSGGGNSIRLVRG